MKIAVLGSNVVGQTLAEKLNSLGHEVMIGTRNVKDTMARSGSDSVGRPPFSDWHTKNAGIKVGTLSEAAFFGEFIVNATNGVNSIAALEQAGVKNLANKIILDIANPLDFSKGMPPTLSVCNTDSLGEQIQRAFPYTKVVKALNTMNAYIMVNPALIPEDHNVFLSSNDETAKAKVKTLLQSFGWKSHNIIDMGDISTARGTEQLLPIWVRLWGTLQNPMFNFKIAIGPKPN